MCAGPSLIQHQAAEERGFGLGELVPGLRQGEFEITQGRGRRAGDQPGDEDEGDSYEVVRQPGK